MDIEKKVKDIIAEQLSAEPQIINLNTSLAQDLKADDLDSIEIVMALEEAFSIEIPDEDAEKLLTVKDVVDYIKKKTGDSPKA